MAVPVLHLNLAPRPSLWRQHHQAIGWAAFGLGALTLVGAIGFTWRAYHQANRAGRDAVSLTEQAKRAAGQEQKLLASLQEIDAAREQSRWKLAERILQERSLPWSRLTAELEQCMVPDMRLKGVQRARSNAQEVVMKLQGEAKTRQAEAAFVESLRAAPVFAQVVLERESERAGGGWDFELSLPTATVPPPFQVKEIQRAAATAAAPKPPPAAPTRSPAPPMGLGSAPSFTPSPAGPSAPNGMMGMGAPRPLPAPSEEEEGGRRRRPGRTTPADPRIPR